MEELAKAEELILNGELDEAQKILDGIQEKSGGKYFVQGRLYMAKSWFAEARKQYKRAVKAEPDNAEYRQALDELEAFRKSEEYREARRQMGKTDGLPEMCVICGCEMCCEGICEGICEGCS